VGKSEGKRPLARHRHSWEDNIKMEIQDVGCGSTDWIELAETAGFFECDDEPLGSIKGGEFF